MEPSGNQTPATSSESNPVVVGSVNAVDETGSLISAGTLDSSIPSQYDAEEDAASARHAREEKAAARRRILKFAALALVLIVCGGLITWQLTHKKAAEQATKADASVRFHNTSIPIANLDTNSPSLSVSKAQTLSINGQLNVNNSLVLAPTARPDGAVIGQLYLDKTTNRLSYYNGHSFQTLLAGGDVVSTTIGGASGVVATGNGLAVSGQTLSNTGVLTLQGQSGNVTLAAGPGIVVNGTTLSNSGLLSLGGLNGNIAVGTGLSTNGGALHNTGVTGLGGTNGDIAVGSGLAVSGGTLRSTGILSATGAGSITVTNDGNGNIIIDGPNGSGGGGGTVASPGGTSGKLAKFTGVQTIADSLISDNGTTVTIGGALTVTGGVTLSTPLAVSSGGTGANSAAGARSNLGAAQSGANSDITSLSGLTTALSVAQGGTGIGTLATNGVIVGSGTSPLSSVVAGSAGQCLVSTAGAPTWSTCPGSGGVASLNGGTGALTLNNASLSGSSITINDASTAAKGIASFNGTNFSVTSGAVNTVQNINTTAAPTFGQLVLTSSQATNPMLVVNNTNLSASGALLDLQLNGTSKLSVSPAGTVTAAGSLSTGSGISAGGNISTSGNFTGGTLNGQTISSAANFTGSLSVGSTLAVTSGASVGGSLSVNTITPTSSLTIGAGGQSFLLQGNASSSLTATNGTNTTTVGFQTPTANVTYNFAAATAGTYSICTTAGNCVGVGGGVTSPGGTTGKLAKFTGSNAIGDSIISDNGTTVTIAGALSVNTLTPSGALTVGATGQNLTLQGATVSLSATASGTTNALTFATPSGSNKTITLPNASGTVAVSASGPLALDANGNLTCPTCLSTGGSGGTTGVTSINSLSGSLTLQGSSAGSVTNGGTTITINDASSSVKGLASFNASNLTVTSGNVNTVQDIAVTSTPTFAGLNLTAALSMANGGTGATNASAARTNLGAAQSGANSDITSLTGLTTALSVAQGGTGITTTPTNGQILIGNGSGYSLNTLSAGTGITITNSAGGISISAPGAGTCAGCANTALSNLASVALNTSLLPGTAGAADLGSGTLPFGQLFLAGTSASPATNNFKITGASTGGTRTIALPDASGTVAVSASGNIALSAAGNISFTGTLGVSSGGTGATALTANGVLIGNGTGAITSLVAGSSNQCLVSTAGTPTWTTCPGSGGATASGTSGKIAKFTGTNTLGDSSISDDGSTVTIGGTLSANTITPTGALTIGASSQATTLQGSTVNISATSAGITNTLTFGTPTGGNQTFVIQDQGAAGTYNLLTTNQANGNYVQLQGASPAQQTGSISISGTAAFGQNVTAGNGINITNGSLQIGAGGSFADYITPLGTTLHAKVTIQNYDPGSYNQIIALGLPVSASSNARVITIADARNTAHQPSIGVLSPDEQQIFGFSWDGSNTLPVLRTSSNYLGLQANGITGATLYSTAGTSVWNVGVASTTNGYLQLSNATTPSNVSIGGTGVTSSYTLNLPNAIGSAGQCISVSSISGSVANLGYATCGGLNSAFLQGGNSFGATAVLGTSDNYDLQIQTNGTTRLTVAKDGNNVTLASGTSLFLQGAGANISNPQGYSNSEAFGLSAVVNGANATAVGYGATADANATAIGKGATASAYGASIAIGMTASASNWGIAIGEAATNTGNWGISIGNNTVSKQNAVAIGEGATANSNSSVALGAGSSAVGNDSIAIGYNATTTTDNQFVVGSSTSTINHAYFGNGITSGTPSAFTLQATSGAGTNITGGDITIAAGQGTGSSTGGSISFQTSAAGASGTTQNNLSSVLSLSGSNGSALFKNTADNTSALQVQNASGTSVFDVDTTNKRIGIGTNTPGRTFDVSINTASTNTLPVRLAQAGAGDIGIEYQTSASNFYEGIDGSDGVFKISSSTAANGTISYGQTAVNTFDTDANSVDAYRVQTGATGGQLSSLSINVNSVDAAPNNHLQLVIYSDDGTGTKPATRLGYTAGFVPTVGWNTVSLTGITIAPNTYYWLGFGTDGNNYINGYSDPSQTPRFGATYSFGTPPSTWVDGTNPTGSGYHIGYDEVMNIAVTGSTHNFGGTPLFTLTDGGQAKFQNATNSTTAFLLQNASGSSLFIADTTNSTIKIAGTSSSFATLQIDNAHFESTQTTAPTISVATCTTSATSVTSGSTDSAGSFSITPSSAAACKITITFNQAYSTAPKSVLITAKTGNVSSAQTYVSAVSTTSFAVSYSVNASVGQAYSFYYWVVQ